MKILNKFGFVVVFAGLALANVAGCSVDVLPAEDGGGTTDQNGDDVSPGDDANPGADDAGGPDVDENGNVDLAGCEEMEVQSPEPFFMYGVEGPASAWHLVEMDFGGNRQAVNSTPETSDSESRQARVFVGHPNDPEFSRAPVRLINRSTHEVKLVLFRVFSSGNELENGGQPLWSRLDGYPTIGADQALTIGELEKGGLDYVFDPHCTVRLTDLVGE